VKPATTSQQGRLRYHPARAVSNASSVSRWTYTMLLDLDTCFSVDDRRSRFRDACSARDFRHVFTERWQMPVGIVTIPSPSIAPAPVRRGFARSNCVQSREIHRGPDPGRTVGRKVFYFHGFIAFPGRRFTTRKARPESRGREKSTDSGDLRLEPTDRLECARSALLNKRPPAASRTRVSEDSSGSRNWSLHR
jgi:hypothetical protein